MTDRNDRPLKFVEIADRICAHLRRFEKDPSINKKDDGRTRYWLAHAGYNGGPKMWVIYINYQGSSTLTKAEATKYLAKLDAGFIGRHYEALREAS